MRYLQDVMNLILFSQNRAASTNLAKTNNENTRTLSEICSKLTLVTFSVATHCSNVTIINFK